MLMHDPRAHQRFRSDLVLCFSLLHNLVGARLWVLWITNGPGCWCLLLLQVAVMERGTGLRILTDDEVDAVVKELEEEKAAAEAAKRGGQAAGTSS